MSSDSELEATSIVAVFHALYIEGYWQVAVSVLFICETFATLDREVRYFWIPQRTGGSLLYCANKCLFVTFYVMLLVSLASFPSNKNALLAVQISQVVPWAVFSTLRAYVLSRSKIVGGLVLALSMSPVGTSLARYDYQVSGENFPPFGCLGRDTTTETMGLRLVILSRAPLIVSDIILIYTTCTKLSSWRTLRDIRQSKRLSLSDILFRGGTIYFVVNILHLILSIVAVAGLGGTSSSEGTYVTIFTTPLTAILVSRFLLDLQQANQVTVRIDADDPLHSSRDSYDDTPSFISSLGGFIDPDIQTEPDDDSDLELHARSREDGEGEGQALGSESQTAGPSWSA